MKIQNILIAICLIAIAAGLRILPHPANFAPVAAIAIFGGTVLPRRLAIWTPVVAMMVSDFIIGLHSLIAVTWGCYALIAFLSNRFLAGKLSLKRGLSMTLGGSLLFFFATNFAVWIWSGMYEHTLAGLGRCFELALPFFRNTAASDLVYTAALFGVYAMGIKYSPRLIKKFSTQA